VFVNGENKRTIGRLKVDALIDESVDKSDSELRSVENTTSIGKTTHQDSVKNLACGAFCLIGLACGAFYFIEKSCLRRIFLLFNHSVVNLVSSFLFCLPIHWY